MSEFGPTTIDMDEEDLEEKILPEKPNLSQPEEETNTIERGSIDGKIINIKDDPMGFKSVKIQAYQWHPSRLLRPSGPTNVEVLTTAKEAKPLNLEENITGLSVVLEKRSGRYTMFSDEAYEQSIAANN